MNPETCFPFIEGLDDEQKNAALIKDDAVISAAAGSGKTRVLTARYGALVMSGECTVEEILTITFTNKAANEMYSRIYTLLAEYAPRNEYARTAIENFHKARICTLDSFCASIARSVCRHYGISPDFTSDNPRIKELAKSLALRFVLDKRENPALQQFIAEKSMRRTADELFADPMLRYSPLSRPLDFAVFEKIQREELLEQWKAYTETTARLVAEIRHNVENMPLHLKLYESLKTVLPHEAKAPDITPLFSGGADTLRNDMRRYFAFLDGLKNCVRGTDSDNPFVSAVQDNLKKFKGEKSKPGLYHYLAALANHVLQWDLVKAVFPLMEEYQALLNLRKREAGILTFTDIAHLAVDGIRAQPGVRQVYRDSLRMIMIDEFQDNNGLQRELIELLAEPARVFYVGDEKQSIYRFRGADVSVFRGLSKQIKGRLHLSTNYRSLPMLNEAFNRIFAGVFKSGHNEYKDFEAEYHPVKSGKEPESGEKLLCFAFFDKGRMDDDDNLRAEDHEAVYIAQKIHELVKGKTQIFDKRIKEWRGCGFGDIAVLQRSYTHQQELERHFKFFNIPFNADKPAGLFYDAPVNDLHLLLKLLVYPDDRIAYGGMLRSPFVRLSDDAFTRCMISGGEIFDPALDKELLPVDRKRYQEARVLYQKLSLDMKELSVSSLITKIWYDYGYRYEALWSLSAHVYLDLYELFFELARTVEDKGKGLAAFLDYLDDLVRRREKTDDSMIPGGGERGVQLMSIHRSKGLEFPVVFLYGCGQSEKTALDHDLANFSESRGLFLKLPQAEELPAAGDYFYLQEQEIHREKTRAELKRLLYVAMTRAECRLFVTGIIPKQKNAENLPEIVDIFESYRTDEKPSISFLRLLPELYSDNPTYIIEAIGDHRPARLQYHNAISMEEAVSAASGEYEKTPVVPPYLYIPHIINASGLHEQWLPQSKTPQSFQGEFNFTEQDRDELDLLLEKAGLKNEDFGVIVHSFIEQRFVHSETQFRIPPRFRVKTNESAIENIGRTASEMAGRFFASELGRLSAASPYRETEFPVLTAVDGTLVSGKIDLLFEDKQSIHIVDFKTDKIEDPRKHTGQLALYRRAVSDIYGKPVRCFLFFTRSGSAIELRDGDFNASPEELVKNSLTSALSSHDYTKVYQ